MAKKKEKIVNFDGNLIKPEVTIETLEVGQPVCKHQNQGEGKCLDCNQLI